MINRPRRCWPSSVDGTISRRKFVSRPTKEFWTNVTNGMVHGFRLARHSCRDDASKVAGIEDLPRCWGNAAARGEEGTQVADRIGEVLVIEQVEELSAKFEIASFGQRKELFDCKIHIYLSRSAQTGSADVSDTCAHCVPAALSHLMGPSWQDI